jgi:prepilin-type N-terminal cleavage/methylation domain-containing protein
MSRHPHPDVGHQAPRADRHARDAGFTLPELLIAMMISGILVVSISMAFTTILRTQGQATDRLAESKDITFVQTWMPVDLSSALNRYTQVDEAALKAELAAFTPPMAYNAVLPGVNVLTVIRPDLEAGAGTYYLVAYRYHQAPDGTWQISRYEIRNPGTASEVVKVVGVAHEIPAPPPEWDGTTPPTHAVEVTSRNQVVLRPIGEDVIVNFESGNEFRTGGGGLSAENQLPTDYSGGFTNPSAPPSRCGGRIALVIDTSGSVPAGNGDEATEEAAESFIRGFTGTPTTLSLNGFDMEGYGMGINAGAKVNNGVRSPFLSLLNPGPTVEELVKRVTDLDNFDEVRKWPGDKGGATRQAQRDWNGDGIHWDQIYTNDGSGTNWEDGLFTVLYRSDGTPYGLEQPGLVVFITDGEPNRVRTAAGGSSSASNADATKKAKDIANELRAQGARTIGVMVGNKSNNSTFVGYLKDVVGPVEWSGSVNADGTINVGNAARADLFKGEFDSLGGILRSILIAECGGTLTVQKRIDTGGSLENPATGTWSYNAEDVGVRELDRSVTSSITFDYSFGAGVATKTVQVVEEPVSGYVWDRAECTAGGVPVASQPNADGSAGVTVTVQADQAVSCLMISRPE